MARMACGMSRLGVVVAVMMVLAVLTFPLPNGSAAQVAGVPCPGQIKPTKGPQVLREGSPEPMNPCPGYEWAKTFGTAGVHDAAVGLDVTADGGAVVLIRTHTSGGATVLKLDGEGTVLWQQNLGYPVGLEGDIQQTSDGGFIAALSSDVPDTILVYRLDAFGNIQWQALYDGPGNTEVFSVAETPDGGFLTAGRSLSGDGVTNDLWVLRLDPTGAVVWQRAYGGLGDDLGFPGVRPTPDGGFVAAGRTVYSTSSWVIKGDAAGSLTWQKTYGGSTSSYLIFQSIQTTTDGGFIVSGKLEGGGVYKWVVVKLSGTGGISWQKTYGEVSGASVSISQTSDGGYVSSATLRFSAGTDYELALLRLTANGNKVWQRSYGGPGNDQPCFSHCVQEAADGNILVAGYTNSFGTLGADPGVPQGQGWMNTDAWVLRVFSDGTISSTCDPAFGTSQRNPTVQGSKIKVGALAFTSSVPSMTTLDPGVTATPGTLVSYTQCAA
ncbi:MAG TPA: hypothetical protein VJ397_07585 [Thermoplasmata archaeon]|nr:hypothetical protein [Thermoplasmata archaeon]